MTGEFVLSISGRDKGRIHVIVATDAEKELVFLCDGKTRRVAKPKPKKLKHIKFLSKRDERIAAAICAGNLTDSAVREAIARIEMNQSRRDYSAEG